MDQNEQTQGEELTKEQAAALRKAEKLSLIHI